MGILARYWFLGGTYAEASLRSGRMRGSYTDDIDGSTNYRSRSNYWGAHAMLGHVVPLSERGQLDAYARVQWQRLGGDAVRTDAGDQLSYDATQALRTRLGARYVYVAGDQTRLYAGAAWEQDARTEVRARLDGKALQSADTNGGATVLEAGARWEPSPSWSLRLSAQGQFGARQGIGERLSSIDASEAVRRPRSGRQMGLDRLQDLHHVFAAKLRHEGGVQAASAWTNRATARSRRSRPRGSPPETRPQADP